MFRANLAKAGIQLSTAYPQGIGKVNLMANKKEPPFFNEDNVGPFYYKLPFYETMELFIETLTGTCFELRVSPFETVISVKAKIQRLEGIPICQQHLIWNNMELEDDYCLNDYNISEGCTLKLVLAMRGGPINTRRVPMEDPLREMAEYMDSSRDEVWEKASCNKQVTFLVYREGDQLNFFRVVDRGDGTLTPLSESLRIDLDQQNQKYITKKGKGIEIRGVRELWFELVNKLLYLHFKDDRCKVSGDALQLMVEMLKIFVQEAAARAIRQAQAEDQEKVDIEQFEKVLPQLLLDF